MGSLLASVEEGILGRERRPRTKYDVACRSKSSFRQRIRIIAGHLSSAWGNLNRKMQCTKVTLLNPNSVPLRSPTCIDVHSLLNEVVQLLLLHL
jgi:hypothetical protein